MATFAASKSNIAYDAQADLSPLGGLCTGIGYAPTETTAYKGQRIGFEHDSATMMIEYGLGTDGPAPIVAPRTTKTLQTKRK